jgi:DNA-binding transcriptional regulator PaaX
MARTGKIQKKILLLLLAGIAISLKPSIKHHFRVIKEARKEWLEIDKKTLETAINALYKSKLVEERSNKDGTVTFILSGEGKTLALTYNLEKMEIKRHRWDKRWRIVIFDIPEKLKSVRESLRYHLNRLGFKKLQHSVFVLPFECRNEVEYIVEFFNARRFVRFIESDYIDNELDLKHQFNLI